MTFEEMRVYMTRSEGNCWVGVSMADGNMAMISRFGEEQEFICDYDGVSLGDEMETEDIDKTCNQIQDMLMTQKEINWNDLPSHQKRGSCCVKNRRIVSISADRTETCELRDSSESENAWVIDKEIPIFKGEGRLYIDELILLEV